jgi:hypothetical protein
MGEFDIAHQPMEFDLTKDLPITGRRFSSHGDFDAGGPKQYGLRERDIVALEQSLRRRVLEMGHALFRLQVGEQTGLDVDGIRVQLGRGLENDDVARERLAYGLQRRLSCFRRRPEDDVARVIGGRRRLHLKFATVFQQLGESIVNQRLRQIAE